jgi:hypothetical protein
VLAIPSIRPDSVVHLPELFVLDCALRMVMHI